MREMYIRVLTNVSLPFGSWLVNRVNSLGRLQRKLRSNGGAWLNYIISPIVRHALLEPWYPTVVVVPEANTAWMCASPAGAITVPPITELPRLAMGTEDEGQFSCGNHKSRNGCYLTEVNLYQLKLLIEL